MNLPPPLIESSETFGAALLWGFEAAAAQGARVITCADPDFEGWPLDDPALLQGLSDWITCRSANSCCWLRATTACRGGCLALRLGGATGRMPSRR